MVAQQPDHDPIIQKFRKWVDDNSVEGALGDTDKPNTRFMTDDHLEKCLQDVIPTIDLLRVLWDHDPDLPRVQPKDIDAKCRKGFAILLLMGMGKYIGHFIQHDSLWDNHMPFEGKAAPSDFPTTDTYPNFFEKFVERQWQFFPHRFHDGVDAHLPPQRILPIKSKELIGTGGFAKSYKIEIHAGYGPSPPDQVQDADCGVSNIYVLKTYDTENQDAASHYQNEIDAFARLKNRSECLGKVVIGFYGSFKQGETSNILLEYAGGGTLEDFLQRNDPPTDSEGIYKLWSAAFEPIKAIQHIHSINRDDDGVKGWHQDIKPSNILVTPSKTDCAFDVQFKLADLGLSHFRRVKSRTSEASDKDSQGTRIYGAPECYRFDDFDRNQSLEVLQSVDIWSLGCVFSEVAVWLVCGKGALERYREDRRKEIPDTKEFADRGCFHNGEVVLECVKSCHEEVISSLRNCDHITNSVIRKMVDGMLDDSESRLHARQLRQKAQNILQDAKIAVEQRNYRSERSLDSHRGSDFNTSGYRKPPAKLPPDRDGSLSYSLSIGHGSRYSRPPVGMRKAQTFGNFEFPQSSPEGSVRESLQPREWDLPPTQMQRPMLEASQRPFSAPHPPTLNHNSIHQVSYSDPEMEDFSLGHSLNGNQGIVSSSPSSLTNVTGDPVRPSVLDSPSPSSNRKTRQEGIPFLTETVLHEMPRITTLNTGILEGPMSTPIAPARGDAQMEVTNKPKPPTISQKEIETWILRKKQKHGTNNTMPPADKDHIMNEVGPRDHVFLIDDARSMSPYWHTDEGGVVSLAKVLAYLVKESDKDGLDLFFTCTQRHHNVSSATAMEENLLRKPIDTVATSNMATSLGRITLEYARRLHKERHKAEKWKTPFTKRTALKPLSIYVFTDAVWQPDCHVGRVIAALAKTVKELEFPDEQVGIQFIRFGSDPVCTSKLRDLDDGVGLGIAEGYDFVDTEPAVGGNIWKMLLGPLNKWYDNDG